MAWCRLLAGLLVSAALLSCHRRSAPILPTPTDAAPVGPTLLTCGAAGCPREPAAAATGGGTLRVHVEAEPPTLCDLVEHDAWSRWIVENQIAETLLFQDPWTGAITPRLAERIEADAHALTLHLRSGVTWHDGAPLSAADVVFTLERARDPAIGADQRVDLEPVTQISSPDDQTVVLTLGRPAPFLRQALSHLSILERRAFPKADLRQAVAARAPIGTGPFRFVRWLPGEEIVLERNDHYWGARPHLDRIVFRIVRDRQVALELYKRGELDVMWRLPSGRIDEIEHDRSLSSHRIYVWPLRGYFFIVWNTRRTPLGDPRVRRALTMLIDRDRYSRIAFGGHTRPLTGPFWPDSESYDRSITPWPFDPKGARALLDQAGVKRFRLTFLVTAGSHTLEPLATLMREDLATVGIDLEVQTVDWAVQLDRLRRHAFDVSALQWQIPFEQDNYSLFHSSQAERGQNYGSLKNARVDELLEQIRLTDDDQARHGIERALHRVLHDEQAYTFLSSPEVQTLVSPRVRDLLPSAEGFSFAAAWVETPADGGGP